jgi:hypothetical protein
MIATHALAVPAVLVAADQGISARETLETEDWRKP